METRLGQCSYNNRMDKKTLEPGFDPAPIDEALAAIGALRQQDACGPQASFATGSSLDPSLWHQGVVCPRPDLGLLRVSGAEAATFLHAQMTNEVEKQPPGHLLLNGYCSAKGRLLATAWQWRDQGDVCLLVSRSLAAPLARRLSMFVLRAKAKVQDVSGQALAGDRLAAALAALGLGVPADGQLAERSDGLVVLAQGSVPLAERAIRRALLVVPRTLLPEVWSQICKHLQPADSPLWRWSDVLSGIGWVTPAVSEHFVPQMINFDLTDGVSFKKGCYPGQEVVARSHYLGKLKRRSFLGRIDAAAAPDPGTDVTSATDGTPCGEVLLAGVDPFGAVLVLFESQWAQARSARIGQSSIGLMTLPYPVPVTE